MPRVKGSLNKSEVKEFLNEKYEESKEYQTKKEIMKQIQKNNNGYADFCPVCKRGFDVKVEDVKISDEGKRIVGRFTCPNCNAKLIYIFRLEEDIDPLFGGNVTMVADLREEKEENGE